MSRETRKGWRWRVADQALNKDLDLLYEPGNWGDILKSTWAAVVARSVARSIAAGREGGRLRCFDPFAGKPTYALVDASRRRLEQAPPSLLTKLQEPYTEKARLASTAILIRDAVRGEGLEARLEVFDLAPERIDAWRSVEGASVLEAESGEQALEALARGTEGTAGDAQELPAIVLVDPYDFFVRWPRLLPASLELGAVTTVLIYSYNKAPRGPGQLRLFRDFRRALRAGLGGGRRALSGRVPADASLARAYHEVLLLGPAVEASGLREELADATRSLARAIVEDGAFEVIDGRSKS